MSTEPESFLTRWSRRKRAAERFKEQPAESVAPEVPATQVTNATEAGAQPGTASASAPLQSSAATPEVPLPPIESLDGLRSDYQAFFQQPVAEDIRHAALKKLFADPHFNQMDMLDVYVDDYTQFEPLPDAMKLRLPSARDFLLDSERASPEAAETPSNAAEPATKTAAADGVEAGSPEADSVKPGSTADDANAGLNSAPTAAPGAVPRDALSANDPEKSVDNVSSSFIPGKTTARNPSSS